jgi:8-oxo-dGTP pyrophosphatase MutT (NUDIX family)
MEEDIRQLSSRVVYQNPWMTLREDQIQRADGSSGIYAVVEKPDFALIIPAEHDGFYLVQEYRYAVGRRVWSFPQGTLPDRRDAVPADLARAELLEETGIQADHLTHLGFLYTSQGSSSQGFNVFVASGLQHSEPQREREEQDMIHAWFSRPGFRRLVAAGDMADDASLAAYALLMSWEDERTRPRARQPGDRRSGQRRPRGLRLPARLGWAAHDPGRVTPESHRDLRAGGSCIQSVSGPT